MSPTSSGKVPPAYEFLDLSDYARPAARWLVGALLPTPATAIHLTLAFTLVGLIAAVMIALDRWLWLAALLLLFKSLLDGADGSLARARQTPSRVGRFLDSDCDFLVNLAVFSGIALGAVGRGASPAVFILALASLLSALLQVSLFNHYYVLYRALTGGDQTSHAQEDMAGGYPNDDPAWLNRLYSLYRLIYGWQDALVARLDQVATPRGAPLTPRFLTAVSVLGLGTQLLLIAICAVVGQPVWALWAFLIVFNAYALLLFALRRLASGRG